MKNFWGFAIFVALVAILFTLNDGLFEKTKTFFSGLIGGISIETPAFDATIADDAQWKTYMSGPCGFTVEIPDTFETIENNDCTGVLEEPQLIMSTAATKVCKTLAEKGKDTSSCHIHTFEIANGTLDPVGDSPKPKKMGLLKGIQTVTTNDDTVTISVVGTSSRGRSYRYTHTAPADQEDIAFENFQKILDTYKLNT